MGAVFGFSGKSDGKLLDSMGSTLAHRGSHAPILSARGTGSIGYIPCFEESVRQRTGAGLYERGEHAIALAGYLAGYSSDDPILESLLSKYREEGIEFSESLRGAFILVVKDGNSFHIVRDGAGARTVYYGQHEGRFLFATEPKAILAAPGFPRRIRPGAVAQYLSFSFVPGESTMLQDVFELPAGHRLYFDGKSAPRLHRYFRFEEEEKEDRPDLHWIKEFGKTFSDAVSERLPEGEPIGLALSGGIDSSVVAAEVCRQTDRPLKTYAIHFGRSYPHELDFARIVAERCNTEHEEVLIRPKDFLPRLRKIIWHLDDPIGDPITVPNYELAERISRDVRWVFNGEGGDPVFGGPKNLKMMLHHWYGGIERDRLFRERMYLASYERAYDDLDRLLTPEWRAQYDSEEVLEGVLTPFFRCERPAGLLDKLMAINIRFKGAHLILPKVDRMMGAWRLTPLAPLFDERLIRLSFRMPPTMKVAKGVEKVVMKRFYQGIVPNEVIERPKSGMRVPVHFWFQKEMKRYARHILSPENVKEVGIFQPERVKQLLEYDTKEGTGRHGLHLWMLIMFEVWRRIVVEGEAV